MNFDTAFKTLIGHEGNFQNDREDKGNWTSGVIGVGILKGTKYGISAAAYPYLDIKNITLDEAKNIYLRDYWKPLKFDDLPDSIRFDLFDTAVNSGQRWSAKLLQRAAKVLDDGVIGPKTIAAANKLDPEQLDSAFNGHRLLFIAAQGIWPKYGKGLVIRIANNMIND